MFYKITKINLYRLQQVQGDLIIRIMTNLHILPEPQRCFRPNRNTVDSIFIYMAFNLAKVFDLVNSNPLGSMEGLDVPSRFLSVCKRRHTNNSARFLDNQFFVNAGVRQTCVFAPVLFNIFVTAICIIIEEVWKYVGLVSAMDISPRFKPQCKWKEEKRIIPGRQAANLHLKLQRTMIDLLILRRDYKNYLQS